MYTSDPAADYEVLSHVRQYWSHGQNVEFARHLAQILKDRFHEQTLGPMSDWVCWYQPGDYSRAALRTLDAEGPEARRRGWR